ncbi:gamma-glutamyltransferase [Qipengyuania sp. JC766]|uniref:gamma-glutamyltransferase n=1 Tax=Qipengyuania sp. JC766 TaxID=3232139 RepID=UPI0034598556
MSFRTGLALLVGTALAACSSITAEQASVETAQAPLPAGAVSAADPRAQAAGEEILRQGGSATDAAIAVMLALTVVEPQSSGIGGGGFYLYSQGDGNVVSLDGREAAPAGATPNWFIGPDGERLQFGEAVGTGLSAGVPGNIALAAEAHRRHGKLDWATLFAPAISLAEQGFEMNPRLHNSLGQSDTRAGNSAEARAIYYDADGQPLPVGSTVVNRPLAATLRTIATGGPRAFYTGASASRIARTIAEATPAGRQPMQVGDVESYAVKDRQPVCGMYRAYKICGMGPPSSGGVAVLQILGQLERFDLASLGMDNPVTWHLFVESQRLAYADRELYIGDDDFVSVPVRGLVDPAYLARRSALIDPGGTLAQAEAGTPPGASQALADGEEGPEAGTSHFSVADGIGNVVSWTSTIESAFGSGLMVDGYYLNNELTDFSFVPEIDGNPVANRVEGGKRPRSSMAPTIVFDPQGEPLFVVGAAGGGTIPVQTARSIIGVIDFDLSVEEAIGMPFIMAFGDSILLERGTWLETSAERFRALGHSDLQIRGAPVKAGAILRTAQGWTTARDPRLSGQLVAP